MRYNKEKKVKKEVTAAMNHTARKVSMYTLMALLLVATAVMVFLSVLSYDRTTQREARRPWETCPPASKAGASNCA